jgi:hypothetical protein
MIFSFLVSIFPPEQKKQACRMILSILRQPGGLFRSKTAAFYRDGLHPNFNHSTRPEGCQESAQPLKGTVSGLGAQEAEAPKNAKLFIKNMVDILSGRSYHTST